MARRSKRTLKKEIEKGVKRQLRRRGGIGAVLMVLVLFVIGLFNPELRDKVARQVDTIGNILSGDNEPLSSRKKSPLKEGVWSVVHIADGDTLDVKDDTGAKHRIRLIGANTPEIVKPNHPVEPYGPEASEFTKRVIQEAGGRVRVAFDGDQIDRYDRNLAMIYVSLPEGEFCLNELLIRQGLARAELQYRFSKGAKDRFRHAEEEAQTARRNIWSGR